jgi:DNA-binding NarL/FixJ family response regulator
MIRVLIADDHGVVRAGLAQLLATFPDVELVGSAANGEEAVALAAERSPDVVLMDLEMPVLDGIQATRPLDPKAARALLSARRTASPADGLSDREREVLAMVAQGLPNKVIAQRLAISEKTVKTHLTSVFRQIGVTDRTQAALWAQRNCITTES